MFLLSVPEFRKFVVRAEECNFSSLSLSVTLRASVKCLEP